MLSYALAGKMAAEVERLYPSSGRAAPATSGASEPTPATASTATNGAAATA